MLLKNHEIGLIRWMSPDDTGRFLFYLLFFYFNTSLCNVFSNE